MKNYKNLRFSIILLIVAIITILGFGSLSASAQCVEKPDDKCVSVSQSILDRTSKALAEIPALREVITRFESERLMTDAQTAAYKNLVATLNEAFDARGKVVADQAMIIGIQEKAIRLYAELVEKMQAAINKPKSGFAKFIGAVKQIALLAAGIYLGRL